MTDETAAATPHGLHTIEDGSGHYCGPTAIAAITGASFPEIYKKIRRVRADRERKVWGQVHNGGRVRDAIGRKKRIIGMQNWELTETMRRFGYKVKATGKGTKLNPKGWATKMTLREFLEDRGHIGLMIVNITGHYVTVSRGYILDCYTGKRPVPMMDYPKLKTRVEQFWQFAA